MEPGCSAWYARFFTDIFRKGSEARVPGVPHRLMEDDIYEGYLLPKGSIVIANIWYAELK